MEEFSYKTRFAELGNAIDDFLAECPDAAVIIPLFSLACRNLLEIHSNKANTESLRVIFTNSSNEFVCLSDAVSDEEREAVDYFISMSHLLDVDRCVEICKKLSTIRLDYDPIHKLNDRHFDQALRSLYLRLYDKFKGTKRIPLYFSDFLNHIMHLEWDTEVYVPFASERLLKLGVVDNGFVTADFCSARDFAFNMYRMDNYALHYGGKLSVSRPKMYFRHISHWFDKDEYDTILCELPDNRNLAEYLVGKLICVKYDRAYILVPSSFLASEKNSDLRKKLSESGKLSEVLSLPDMGLGDYALITLDDNEMQVTSFVDAHGMYLMNKDQGKSQGENLDDLLEILDMRFPELDDWEEQYINFPSSEFRNNGYILNPKYYIKHKLSYEGDGECEYVKLGDLLSPCWSTKQSDGEIVYCNYDLAPANEFAKASFRRVTPSVVMDEDMDESELPVVDKDCLVCYFEVSAGFNGNRVLYWQVNNSRSLFIDEFDGADVFTVDTKRVDPNYLIHQLYRPETYLQIRQASTLSFVSLEDTDNYHPLEDIQIPLPKAKSRKESLAIQKQIYERKKKIFACLDDAVTDLPDNVEVKTSLSPIVIDKNRNIKFIDYNRTVPLQAKMFALYVFLMRTSVDERGNRIGITHKNIADYHYEIGRIYYAVKRKLNDYRKSLPESFGEEYKSNVKNIQDNAFSELINKTNKEIEKYLKGAVPDEIIEKYQIPSGANRSRNVVFDAEITVDSGFPKDFFSESNYCYPNSHYSEEELINLDVTEDSIRKIVGKDYKLIVQDDDDLLEISQNLDESHKILVKNTDVRELFCCRRAMDYDGKDVFTPSRDGSGAFARKVKYVKLYNPDSKHYLYLEIKDLSYEKRDWKEFAVFRFAKLCDTNLIEY